MGTSIVLKESWMSAGLKISNKCHKIVNRYEIVWGSPGRLVACRPPSQKPMSGRFRKQRSDPANRFASCVNLRRTAAETFAADRRMAGSYRIVPDRFLVLGKRQVQRLANGELRAASRASWPGSYKNGFWRACSVSCKFETETRVSAAIEFDQVFGF